MAAAALAHDTGDTVLSLRGPLEGHTHFGASGERGEGPYAYIWLLVEDGVVRRAAYQTPGCPASSILGETLCRLAAGRPLDVVKTLTAEELIAISGPVPEGRGFYAQMLVDALRRAAEERE